MEIAPFGLERWFAEYEHEADIMLAESGIRSLAADRFDLTQGDVGYVIPTNGAAGLRGDIAARYEREPDEVLVTSGTQEANLLVFLGLLEPGDHVVCVTPTYQALHAIPEALASVTRVWLEPPEWRLDPDRVAEAVQPETQLIVINNPNNPTGRYHPAEVIEACYEIAVDTDAYLLCDEVYRLLDPEPIPPVASLGRYGISTTSLTKAYGLAGARFGWLAGSPAVVEAAWEWKDYTTISPSIFGHRIAEQVFDGQEAEILAENRALASKHRRRVDGFLDEHGLSWYHPTGVNGFVTVPDGFEGSMAFCEQVVEEESVVLAPGAAFGVDDRFRIGFGLPTPELAEGLSRLGRFLDRHT